MFRFLLVGLAQFRRQIDNDLQMTKSFTGKCVTVSNNKSDKVCLKSEGHDEISFLLCLFPLILTSFDNCLLWTIVCAFWFVHCVNRRHEETNLKTLEITIKKNKRTSKQQTQILE